MEEYITGSKYEGDLVNAKPEGNGVFHFNDGTRYEGEFIRGVFHGKGTIYFPNRGSYKGTWENGVMIKGKYTYEDGLEHKETEWDYCKDKDRRYWLEHLTQLSPGGEEKICSHEKGKNIKSSADNMLYDSVNGYYSSKTKNIHDFDTHETKRENLNQKEIDEITSRAYKFSC